VGFLVSEDDASKAHHYIARRLPNLALD
jgi:hypothetical protein